MSLREKILKLPLWKAAILVLFVSFIFTAAVEEVFIHQIFSVMDKIITKFDKEEKDEKNDWNSYEKSYAKFEKKSQDSFNEAWDKQEERFKQERIKDYCKDIFVAKSQNNYIQKLEKEKNDKSIDVIVRAWHEDILKELKKETLDRQNRFNSAKNMLRKYNFDENRCGEINQ